MSELDPDVPEKKGPGLLRKVLVVAAVLACAGFWIWTRYGVTKQPLGGPCSWAIDCGKDAPRCMRPDVDEPGICSRACVPPEDCAPGIRCVEVELDTRDDNGAYVKEGTCVPQTFLDARKAKARGDAGTKVADSVLDVPESVPLEGELTVRTEKKGAPPGPEKTWLVRGTLVRTPETEGLRKIVDTAALRVFSVDDKKHTFGATALASSGAADDVTVNKTDRKDRVAERDCEVWELVEKKTKREACVLLGAAFVDPGIAMVPAWTKELSVRSALALRVVELDAKGQETSRIEATRWIPRPLERALFTIPKSYKNAAAR